MQYRVFILAQAPFQKQKTTQEKNTELHLEHIAETYVPPTTTDSQRTGIGYKYVYSASIASIMLGRVVEHADVFFLFAYCPNASPYLF